MYVMIANLNYRHLLKFNDLEYTKANILIYHLVENKVAIRLK